MEKDKLVQHVCIHEYNVCYYHTFKHHDPNYDNWFVLRVGHEEFTDVFQAHARHLRTTL